MSNTPNRSQNFCVPLIAIALILSGCSSIVQTQKVVVVSDPVAAEPTSVVNPDVVDPDYDRIKRHVYVGFGIGKSRLEPDTSEVLGVDVNQRVDPGHQFTLGVDINRMFSVELHSADLGDAGLSPTGSINYDVQGISALLYAGKHRHHYKRHGLTAYGRLGVGVLTNSANGDVPYQQDNAMHILFGAGIEYMTRSGVGVRAEGILYEEDIQYAQLGLIYRFGRRDKPEEPVITPPLPEPVIAEPVVVEQPVIEAPKPDACTALSGVLKGVTFHSDSEKLTASAVTVLNEVAITLAQCETKLIALSAHTDSQGSQSYNQKLSERRVTSVAQFLINTGIDRQRITARAFGELSPIDTNATREGRQNNRRVELIAE